jgi:hypothetical protein
MQTTSGEPILKIMLYDYGAKAAGISNHKWVAPLLFALLPSPGQNPGLFICNPSRVIPRLKQTATAPATCQVFPT